MAVLIEGMEMPKSCYVCPFCDYVSARCDAVKGNPYTQESRYEKRDDFCPLIEVPEPHGRLIDADAVTLEDGPYEYDDWCKWALERYQDAPTVIPASESKERPAFLPQYELTPRSEEG